MTETKQFTTFFLGEHLFGVEVAQVQEVLPYQDMTRVPLAPAVIDGLINLRGQIVTAVNLRRRLAFPDRAEDGRPMNVVLQLAGGPVSLLVDQVGDVITVEQDSFEPNPETLQGPLRELTFGAYKLADRLMVALDAQAVATPQ